MGPEGLRGVHIDCVQRAMGGCCMDEGLRAVGRVRKDRGLRVAGWGAVHIHGGLRDTGGRKKVHIDWGLSSAGVFQTHPRPKLGFLS